MKECIKRRKREKKESRRKVGRPNGKRDEE
jgi:hypothetical protein